MQSKFCTIIILLLATLSLCVAANHEKPTAGNPSKIESFGLPQAITTQQVEAIKNEAAAQPQMILEPIYIGGARYQLNILSFRRSVFYPNVGNPFIAIPFTSYRASVPVYGDIGQDLFFDIFGNSGTENLRITAYCGAYHDSDSGPEYVMSKVVRTDGSCQTLNVEFITSGFVGVSSINLNILISEQL